MAVDNVIVGGLSGNKGEVTVNKEVLVALGSTPATMGGARFKSENDSGTYTGAASLGDPETSQDSRLRVGVDSELFSDSFNANALNSNLWTYITSVLAATQNGAGDLVFSSTQGTVTANGALYRTYQYFPFNVDAAIVAEFTAGQFTAPLIANEVVAFGFGLPASVGVLPTDGVYWQITSAGVIGVLAYSGTVTQTGVLLTLDALAVGSKEKFTVVVAGTTVEFWVSISNSLDKLLARVFMPAANGRACMQGSLPLFMQKFNAGNVSNTNTFRFSDVYVGSTDLASNLPYTVQRCLAGQNGNVAQNGATAGQTTSYVNSSAPTAAALTNTTALVTGLGGQAAILPTLAVNTDGIVFSFQAPVPSTIVSGKNLLIYGVRIHTAVSVVLAGGPVVYQYTVAFGHTAISMTTLEFGTNHAPRKVALGFESFAATAAVGAVGQGVYMPFACPIVVRPGEFVAITAKNIGVVTTTGAITMTAAFDAVWV